MGVDFYLKWSDQTENERKAQITGFATTGEQGYIRESYGGAVLATEVFCPESFDFHPCYVMPAGTTAYSVRDVDQERGGEAGFVTLDTLRDRLPDTLVACHRRYDGDYGDTHYQAFLDFLDLAERKLAEGREVWIYNSY